MQIFHHEVPGKMYEPVGDGQWPGQVLSHAPEWYFDVALGRRQAYLAEPHSTLQWAPGGPRVSSLNLVASRVTFLNKYFLCSKGRLPATNQAHGWQCARTQPWQLWSSWPTAWLSWWPSSSANFERVVPSALLSRMPLSTHALPAGYGCSWKIFRWHLKSCGSPLMNPLGSQMNRGSPCQIYLKLQKKSFFVCRNASGLCNVQKSAPLAFADKHTVSSAAGKNHRRRKVQWLGSLAGRSGWEAWLGSLAGKPGSIAWLSVWPHGCTIQASHFLPHVALLQIVACSIFFKPHSSKPARLTPMSRRWPPAFQSRLQAMAAPCPNVECMLNGNTFQLESAACASETSVLLNTL